MTRTPKYEAPERAEEVPSLHHTTLQRTETPHSQNPLRLI